MNLVIWSWSHLVIGERYPTLSHCSDLARNHCAANTRDVGGNRFTRGLSADTRRSLDLCRPAAISGALEAISRLTLATRRSLSFACAVVSGLIRVAEVTKSDKINDD